MNAKFEYVHENGGYEVYPPRKSSSIFIYVETDLQYKQMQNLHCTNESIVCSDCSRSGNCTAEVTDAKLHEILIQTNKNNNK